MRKDALTALRVIDRATSKISTNRYAQYHRTGERIVRPPANKWHLVAQLMHGRPYIVEELNLDHRLQSTRAHTNGASNNVGFGKRRVEDAVTAEVALQATGKLENSAFAL